MFADLAPMDMHGLGEPAIAETAPEKPFEEPSHDLFDLNSDSKAIEQERIAAHSDDFYQNDTFDSIAAADEIETDLDQLSDFTEPVTSESNVIPLRPTTDSTSAAPPAAPHDEDGLGTGTGWVKQDEASTEQSPDPWADMRPTDEANKRGFWSNRPKFFGGDERRRRKSERHGAGESEPVLAVEVNFDKACPRCGSECKVDLDDPIGRRVHVSCPSCSNIWYTPYILGDSQTG